MGRIPHVGNVSLFLTEALRENKSILLEGQLGALRDPDHGIYPMTTSSTLAGYGAVGAGLPPHEIKRIVTIVKAYSSCVGAGAFVSEIFGEEADELRQRGGDGGEYGATTGRPRKVGILDLPMVKHAVDTIGVDSICLTRLDTLQEIFPYSEYPVFPVCTGYGIKGEDGSITNLTDADNNVSWYDVLANSDKIVPVYTLMNNWLDRNYTYGAAMDLIKFINDFVGVDVEFASTGKNKSDIQTFVAMYDKKSKDKW